MITFRKILLSAFALVVLITPAHAQFASGGNGLHKDKIFWLSFGATGTNVKAGVTASRTLSVGGIPFVTTCVLSNAVSTIGAANAPLNVYLPGTWQGDGLDELYNVGGNNPGTGGGAPNTLNVGLSVNNAEVEFDIDCSATFAGANFVLKGLVISDAEASGGVEYTAVRITNGGTLRIIDSISQCGTIPRIATPTVGGFTQVEFRPPSVGNSCENNATPLLRAGPIVVGFLDGSTKARYVVRGGGGSAIAVGVIARFDINEAIPASYGVAIHQLEQPFSGGVATAGTNYLLPANLAQLGDRISLGPTVLPDSGVIQPIGSSDTDALPKKTGPDGPGYADIPLPNPVTPGTTTYTINNVICDGNASVVRGWIDFDGNGTFDVDERTPLVTCPPGTGTTVNLTWTLPLNYKPQITSYMRLRIAIDPASIATPTGISNNGEVEDYRIQLPGISDLAITKTNTPGVNGDLDQTSDTVQSGAITTYTLTARNNGPTAADGAVISDPPVAGLDCSAGPITCAAAGGAVCPTSPTVSQLQAGVAIPTMPLNGSVVFTLACTVTATGF